MNLQNFRDLLKPLGERFWPKRKVHEAPAFFWHSDQATYDALGQTGRDQIDRYVCHPWYHQAVRSVGPLPPRQPIQRLPFDSFILRTDDEVTGDLTWRLIVEQPNLLFPDDACWGLLDRDGQRLVAVSCEVPGCTSLDVWDTARREVRRDETARAFMGAIFTETVEWQRQFDPAPEVSMQLVADWRKLQAVRLRPFLFELFHPSNHVVKVTPPGPGRSVQWREGHSHYLILDRQTMAHVGPQAGKISEAEKAEAIHRAAHRRRAHTRILRHPKWGERVGAHVPVRSAWIGPREWEGPDGKTYVVLERKPGVRP